MGAICIIGKLDFNYQSFVFDFFVTQGEWRPSFREKI